MKKLFVMLAALLAIALPQASQAMNTEGMYVGGLGGINWLTSDKSHENYKAGWLAGGYVGYRMCDGIRGELEATYRGNKHKHAHRPVQNWSFMVNGYYELNQFMPCDWCVTPYVGGGIGYDRTKYRKCSDRTVETQSSNTRHTNGFAWQLMVGGLYPIDECMEMGLEYRFHKNEGVKHLYNNAIDLRVNWFF